MYGLTAASATTMGAACLLAMVPDDVQANNAAIFFVLSSAAFGGLAFWMWLKVNDD